MIPATSTSSPTRTTGEVFFFKGEKLFDVLAKLAKHSPISQHLATNAVYHHSPQRLCTTTRFCCSSVTLQMHSEKICSNNDSMNERDSMK